MRMFGFWSECGIADILGLSSFALLAGPSSDTPTSIDLGGVNTTLFLRRVGSPSALAMLGGLALLGGLVARRKKG